MPFSDNLAKPNHCQRLIFRVKRELKLIESLHTTCKTRIFFLDSSIFVFVRKPRNSFANQEKPRNSNARYPLRHRLPPRLRSPPRSLLRRQQGHQPRSWHPLGESREIRMRRGVLGAERQISHDDLHVPLGSLRFEDKIQRLEFFNFFSFANQEIHSQTTFPHLERKVHKIAMLLSGAAVETVYPQQDGSSDDSDSSSSESEEEEEA